MISTLLFVALSLVSLTIVITGYNTESVYICNGNNTIDTDCLQNTTATPGNYTKTMLTVDSNGLITYVEDLPEQFGIINSSFTLTVYVDSLVGTDTNDGLSLMTSKETIAGAFSVFAGKSANNCNIYINNFIDLGTNPVLDFFPATFSCQSITVVGPKIDTFKTSVASVEVIMPNGRSWSNVTLNTGVLNLTQYSLAFVRNEATQKTMTIDTNDAMSLSVIAGIEEFNIGDQLTLFQVVSEIRWSGTFTINTPQKIDFECVIFKPAAGTSIHSTNSPQLSTYSGCKFDFSLGNGQLVSNSAILSGVVINGNSADIVTACIDVNYTAIYANFRFQAFCNAKINSVKIDPSNSNSLTVITSSSNIALTNVQFLCRLWIFENSRVVANGLEIVTTNFRAFRMRWQSVLIVQKLYFPTGVFFEIWVSELVIYGDSVSTLTAVEILVIGGSKVTLGTNDQPLQEFISGRFNIGDGSEIRSHLNTWKYDTPAPMLTLNTASMFYNTGSALNWNTSTTFGNVLINVVAGSRTYGAIGIENANFPGNVLLCGTNVVTDATTITNDLSTNTFCS